MTVTAALGAAAFSVLFGVQHLFDRADASIEAPDTSMTDPDAGNVSPDPGNGSPSPAGGATGPSTTSPTVPSTLNRASSSGGLSVPTQPPVSTRRRPRVVSGAT
jgi:hypothetical protein